MTETQDISILGTQLRVRTDGSSEALIQAAQQVEEYVQNIQEATKIADTRQLLLAALLNRTMEMQEMNTGKNTSGDTEQSLVEWATQLTGTIRSLIE